MNCLDCHPDTSTPAVAICGRCGAGLCAEHIVETDDYLTFTAPINRPVQVAPSVRHLRCSRCAAAERAQALRKPCDEADQPARPQTPVAWQAAGHPFTHARARARSLRELAGRRTRR
jgi:hypothetical protein